MYWEMQVAENLLRFGSTQPTVKEDAQYEAE